MNTTNMIELNNVELNNMNRLEVQHVTTKERVRYLLEKYSIKVQHVAEQVSSYTASDRNQYIDEDPNFLHFYNSV
ncbi:hypothetical protein HOA92_02005 [archaeon]|nr:hypothetical protein [archaeon]MBT6761788.1 hypothetical protein [archaeon]